jgi:hypothetical protein
MTVCAVIDFRRVDKSAPNLLYSIQKFGIWNRLLIDIASEAGDKL